MECFEFFVATSAVSKNGGLFVPDERFMYAIPEDAQELLEPILEPHEQNPTWYFDTLNSGRPPAPWALVCLDKEYSIAGHIATCRPKNSGIAFSPYTKLPNPMPKEFVPKVGVITLQSKMGLEEASDKSPLFKLLWEGFKNCASEQRWLIIVDSLSDDWLAQVVPTDSELWLSTR